MILARTVLIAWTCNICVKAGYFPPDPPIVPPACYPTCSADRYCKEGTCVCTSGNEHLGKCVECVFPRVYKSCPTSCPRSCDDDPNTPIFCTKECDLSRYCVCAEGYVEKSKIDNTCVKKEECRYCKAPKVYKDCPTACPETCETVGNTEPRACHFGCRQGVNCVCPKGYVEKSRTDSTCVKVSDCVPTCQLAKDPGTCKARLLRFYFNAKSGRCQRFYYGGCKGNANRFDSRKECEASCSVCKLKKDPGPCDAAMRRYFYNTDTGDCEKFYYGGCPGNANRFFSLDQCRKKCVDPCIFKFCPAGTICKNGVCVAVCQKPKEYNGCPTNCPITCDNINDPPSGCLTVCRPGVKCVCPEGYVEKSSSDSTCVKISDCYRDSCLVKLCPDGTVCRNGKCIDPCIFTTCQVGTTCKNGICIEICQKPKEYNGCPTNCPITCDNINDPPGICQAVCRPGVKCVCPKGYVEKSSRDSTCVEISECRDSCFLKFCPPGTVCRNGKCIDPCIFTTCPVGTTCKNGICIDICQKPKEYNGCPTNCPKTCDNFNDPPGICQAVCRPGVKCVCPKGYVERSSSDSTCVKTSDCVPTCQLPKDPGPCEALMPRFYFNAKSGTCQKFYYGGCKGNANRFDTKEECEKSCSVCKLNKDYGPCEAAMPRYFYNTNTGDCEKFYYGGCEGNANRFSSLAECRKKCVDPCIRKFCPFGTFCRNGMCVKICGAGYCGPNGACLYDKCYCLNAAGRDCTIY